eukprot:6867425-Pyramimonas_sp.AAC.1
MAALRSQCTPTCRKCRWRVHRPSSACVLLRAGHLALVGPSLWFLIVLAAERLQPIGHEGVSRGACRCL